jgi:hypothetical protein
LVHDGLRYRDRLELLRRSADLVSDTEAMRAAHHAVGRRTAVAALLVLVAATATAFASQVTVVPAIDGSGTPVDSPKLFGFHLDPFDPASSPLVLPCGEPVDLPQGGFYVWVEGPNRISQRMVLHGPGLESGGATHREFRIEVGPAGTAVVQAASVGDRPREPEVRLLSLNAHIRSGHYHNEFARTCTVDEAAAGVQMPVGPVILAIVDPSNGRYLRVSRPQDVVEGGATVLDRIASRTDRAQLVVRYERPESIHSEPDDDVSVVLRTAADPDGRAPDVLVPSSARVYAIWYDLLPGTAAVDVVSASFWAPSAEVTLSDGDVTSFSGRLEARPHLDVVLILPSELDGEPTTFSVRDGDETISTIEFEPMFPTEARIDGLPPRELNVNVTVGPWSIEEEADLRHGDTRLVLAPETVRVTGAVTVEGSPADASVGFLTNRSRRGVEVAAEFVTDDYGEFEAVLLSEGVQPFALVSVESGEPIWWFIENPPLRDGDHLEIDLKGRALDVHVVDVATGKGIPESKVSYGWTGEGGGGRTTTTDETGRITLPPVPVATVDVHVQAVGYRSARRTIDYESDRETEEIVIGMERESEGTRISIILSDGTPAFGAEVALIPAGAEQPRWTAVADPQGRVLVETDRASELFAARHPRGGLVIAPAADLANGGPVRLPPPAGPLTIRVIEPSGTPVPYARMVLWISGFRFQDGTLAWLTESQIAADREGLWTAHHLPARPLEALAWQLSKDPDHQRAMSAGELDYRRQTLTPPWAGVVSIEAVLR